jgi:hypothetical protein
MTGVRFAVRQSDIITRHRDRNDGVAVWSAITEAW